eukprot:COSAG05_NODE_18287_length_310_cov_1.696682_1_plen_89_part_01
MAALQNAQAGTAHGSPTHSDHGALEEDMAPPPCDISRETVAANATKEDTTPAKDDMSFRTWINSTLHRRTQVTPQACARVHDFQALSAA